MNRFSSPIATLIVRAANKDAPRRLTIATCVFLMCIPASAQRGGGARGGMGARAGAPAAVSGAGTGASRAGSGHAIPGRPRQGGASRRSLNRPPTGPGTPGAEPGWRAWWFAGRNGFNNNNCWGNNCWNGNYNPWWGTYPYWWGGEPSSIYDQKHERDDDEESSDRYRYENGGMPPWGYGYPYPYPYPPPPPARPAAEQAGSPIIPATVLVFRDQHKQEIQSYAIVGGMLWNFAPQRIEKISLTELDLAATVKINNERGHAFRVPSSKRSANDASSGTSSS